MIVSSSLLSFGSAIVSADSCKLLSDTCGWSTRAFLPDKLSSHRRGVGAGGSYIPGGRYPMLRKPKRQLFGRCGIDLLAGPTEFLVVAAAEPALVARDVPGQAEHDPNNGVCLICRATVELEKQLRTLPTRDVASFASRSRHLIYRWSCTCAIRNFTSRGFELRLGEEAKVPYEYARACDYRARSHRAVRFEPHKQTTLPACWAGYSQILAS